MSEVKEVPQTQEQDTTLVKIRFTEIKYFNEELEKVETVKVLGKLTIVESRKYITEINKNNILVSKLNTYEEIKVNTVALYQLKQD